MADIPDVHVNNIVPDGGRSYGYGSGDGFGFGGNGIVSGLLLGGLMGNRGGMFGNYGYGNGGGYVGSPAASAVASEVVLGPTLNAIQGQINNLSSTVSHNAIAGAVGDLDEHVQSGLLATLGGIKDNSNLYLQGQAALSTAQASGNFTTLQSINGLGAAVTAQANQNALQQLNSFNGLTTSTLQGFNGQAMATQNATNQIIAQGAANAAAMAACCCEIKEAICKDGSLTRALINDTRMHDLEDQLNQVRLKASQSDQTATILAALASGNGNSSK